MNDINIAKVELSYASQITENHLRISLYILTALRATHYGDFLL